MEIPDRTVAAGLDAIESQVAIVDSDGIIRYTNDAWDEFGRENGLEGAVVGPGDDYLAVCVDSDDDERNSACSGLEAVLAGDRDRYELEYPCHSPDEKRWFIMRATPYEVDGGRFAIVMHVDITDRKLAEIEARERTEQIEMVARVLSHDLRNPLTVAMGYLGELDAPADETEPVARQLERMNDIIENALVIARGSTELEPTTLDLETACRDAWESVETEHATLHVDDTRPIQADPRLVPHLFENLFRNSVEHAGPDVTVTVGTTPDGFYVEDDGPGLPPGDVFESDSASGLGLLIVEAVVDAHGWTLETPRQVDGARFEFNLQTDA